VSAPTNPDVLAAARKLLDLLAWVRDKLERLERSNPGEYVRSTVHALIRALDPSTNPRLRNALEDLDVPTDSPER
jgi:hypothetical protein